MTRVLLSVENKCKFCDWEAKDGAIPLFLGTKGCHVTAFCPMCNWELSISWQKIEENDLTNEN